MGKVITFKVEISGLENKIWRKIEISDNSTLATLAYTILATFNSLSYHLYEIKHGNVVYSCSVADNFKDVLLTTNIKIKDIDFTNPKLEMTYDFGTPTTFTINYLSSKDMKKGTGTHYPYIIDGEGTGMIDDISCFDLKEIVEFIDKNGYSKYNYTPGYNLDILYDYRNYDIKSDNRLLKGEISYIKSAYEED